VSSITQIVPRAGMTSVQRENAVARLVVLGTLVCFAATLRPGVLMVGIACLLALGLTKKLVSDADIVEPLSTGAAPQHSRAADAVEIELQGPTRANPLMNVMLTDYKDDPTRPPAAPAFDPVVEQDVNVAAADSELYPDAGPSTDGRSRLYQDLGDELAFDQSMRNFYAMPNTTIPNAQDAFLKYCYGGLPSCRGGDNLQCWKNVNNIQTRTA
jgi:hypothetical protein